MAKLTPQEAAEKYAARMKAAVPEVRRGIERVTEAPGVKAAAKVGKMRTKLIEALDSGKWERRVSSVPLSEWKRAALDKGVGRIPAGVDAAVPKMTTFFGELFPFQESLQSTVQAMPDTTIEDSINRAATWIRGMSKFERRG